MSSSLFERHGGFPFMSRLVLDFYDRVLSSERLAPFFAQADMRRLVDHQTKFIASITGGPASCSNEMLAEIHADLCVDSDSFEEMVRLMEETLISAGLSTDDRAEILGALNARKHCIVARDG